MSKQRSVLAALIVVFTLAVPAAFGAVRGSFQRTLQVNGAVDLQLLTRSGDITVRSGPAGTVTINAKIHTYSGFFFGSHVSDDQIREIEKNPPVRQTGNMIKVDYPQYKDVSIDYDVTVPANTTLHAETGSGNQTIRGLQPYLAARSGSGDIDLNDVPGGAHVETGSGNINGSAVGGWFEARTGSGDIRVRLTGSGTARAHTGSGNIELHDINGGLELDTGSGDVTIDGQPKNAWNVGTSSGDVRMRIPGNASFDVDVSTGSGSITVDHPVNTTVQGRANSSNRHVSGKVNAGGPMVKVHTGSGDVRIY